MLSCDNGQYMDKRELAEKFRGLRKASGLRQEDLAANSGVSIGVIKEIEAGKGNPTLDTLVTISSALGVEFESLLSKNSDRASRILALQSTLQSLADDQFDAVEAFIENTTEAGLHKSTSKAD